MARRDDVVALSRRFRAALARRDAEALARLVRSYRGIYNRLNDLIDALSQEVAAMERPGAARIYRLGRYIELRDRIIRELRAYGAEVRGATIGAATDAARLGAEAARAMTIAQVRASFAPAQPQAIKALAGLLHPEGRLWQYWERAAGKAVADRVAAALATSAALGLPAREIAREITAALGTGLSSAMRTARTVVSYAYREANRESMVANGDTVAGWVWAARLDERTCASCVAMHGSVHEPGEELNDHWNGRCAAIPIVRGRDPVISGTGADWLRDQPKDVQDTILGKSKAEAWRDGKFALSDLVTVHRDRVFGPMLAERALADILREG